jgi:putative two-component system response regulator
MDQRAKGVNMQTFKINKKFGNIPAILLAGMTGALVEARSFQPDAADFIGKPFPAPLLSNHVNPHPDIDKSIREQTTQLERLQNGIVFVLADMVEKRDKGTGGHVERTTAYIEILVNAMMERRVYADELDGMDLKSLVASARLHDVGKITISDVILNKPGKLTEEEYEIMKTHSAEGERIIDRIVSRTGNVEFLQSAKLFTCYHHERWDGKGYHNGLAGADIPLLGRIMAIADVYDALVSKRPYKKPFADNEAVSIIMDGSGTQFDPLIANVFFEVSGRFNAVRRRHG